MLLLEYRSEISSGGQEAAEGIHNRCGGWAEAAKEVQGQDRDDMPTMALCTIQHGG